MLTPPLRLAGSAKHLASFVKTLVSAPEQSQRPSRPQRRAAEESAQGTPDAQPGSWEHLTSFAAENTSARLPGAPEGRREAPELMRRDHAVDEARRPADEDRSRDPLACS